MIKSGVLLFLYTNKARTTHSDMLYCHEMQTDFRKVYLLPGAESLPETLRFPQEHYFSNC